MKPETDKPVIFQARYLPRETSLVGLAALAYELNLEIPVRKPACISAQRFKLGKKDTGEWLIFDRNYAIDDTTQANLSFALRHEDLDLLVLKHIFLALPEKEIVAQIKATPTGVTARRLWFLYEFLTNKTLKLKDAAKNIPNVDLLDSRRYFVSEGTVSFRHRVRNNMLGTARFCPQIRRSKTLDGFVAKQLSNRVKLLLKNVSPNLIARAASFLLLADTQASFAIEGERLPINTKERWLKAIQQVGRYPLAVNELNRLHSILIGDYRFTKPGFREGFVYLGQRTILSEPLPEFIGARPQDLDDLIEGLIDANAIMGKSSLDAVLQAAAVAFGFVYIHPYEDGNGRLHRCLIHHVLSEKQFSLSELVFPVSSVMLKQIGEYRKVLQDHTGPLMQSIQWVPTIRGNVEVKNDTADLYRFFDCTEAAEFLYHCVEETIEKDVPYELDYLKRHDLAMQQVREIVEMPNRLAEDFILFMRQNDWKLPKRRRQNEFAKLTDSEVDALESVVRSAFHKFDTAL